jgi:hypothetical protein
MGPVLLLAGLLLLLLGAASSVRTNVAATRPMRSTSRRYGLAMLIVGALLTAAGAASLLG